MIGGMDTIFELPSGPIALDFCLRLVSQWWQNCVFAVDDDPAIFTSYAEIAFRAASEVIVYRDQASCDIWDEIGYADVSRGTMVYLISEPARLTLVTDHDPSPEIVALTEAITMGLPTAFPFWTGGPLGKPSEAA